MLNKTKRRLLVAAATVSFGIGFVSSSLGQDARFDHKVRVAFFAGFGGDAASLAAGMKACEDVLASSPKHAEALVWHGAGLFFQAGSFFRKGDAQKGMELFQKGIAEMDQAVALEPDNLGVRIPRGAVLLTATRAMGASNPMVPALLQKGLSDYSKAYDMQKDMLDGMGQHPRGELLFGIAEGSARAGDMVKAQSFFDMIVTGMPGTPYAERAKLWFETKSLPLEKTGCIGCHAGK